MNKIVIAIDGFSSCGKSTMAKDLARKIGYIYVDSGAMYRAITLFCIQNNLFEDLILNEIGLVNKLGEISIKFKINSETKEPETYLNDENVESLIRSMEVSKKVSIVSSLPVVRKALVAQQQLMRDEKGIVMDGRDIGTVVFPEAELKIFVTATPEIRAQRRLDELRSKGDELTSFAEVLDNLQTRDHLDQTRQESPLKQAEDALVLNNSYLTKEEQMEWLLAKFNEIAG